MSEPDWSELLAAPDSPDNVWYACQCHCGATRFSVLHAPLEASAAAPAPVLQCNCSICVTHGYLLIYAERRHVRPERGWDELRDYRFASRAWPHKFCGTCGTSVAIDFLGRHPAGDVVAVNARVLQGVDVDALNLRRVDGRSAQPEFNKDRQQACAGQNQGES